MDLTKHFSLISGLFFALATVANAQDFTGSIGIQDQTQTSSFTSSSLTLDNLNYTEPGSGSGTFASTIVPNGTEAYVNTSTIDNLSSTPETENINDFVVIGGPGPTLPDYPVSPGTTPNDRFDFELQTLSEDYISSSICYFIGTGILTDTQGDYSPTSAELLVGFSGANNYSFTLQAVPEPATFSLAAVGLLGAMAFRRRKN